MSTENEIREALQVLCRHADKADDFCICLRIADAIVEIESDLRKEAVFRKRSRR